MRIAFTALVAFAICAATVELTHAATISPGGMGTLGTVNYVSGNLALAGVAVQSSSTNGTVAADANDGNTNGSFGSGSTTHTNTAVGEFWRVDLAGPNEFALGNVTIFNRTDCCGSRLAQFDIVIGNSATSSSTVLPQVVNGPAMNNTAGFGIPGSANFPLANNTIATSVQITQQANFPLSLAEVQAFGDPSLELSGDTLEIDINSLGNDFVNVEGAATLDGYLDVPHVTGFTPGAGDLFNVLNAASIDATGLVILGNFGFNIIDEVDGSQTLQLVAAPEPGSLAVWGLGALAFGLAAWRLRRSKG